MKWHEEYQKAMRQITPSQRWKEDTLKKLTAIKQQTAQKTQRHWNKKQRWAAIAWAAVLCLMLVPGAKHLMQPPLVSGDRAGGTVRQAVSQQPQAAYVPDACLDQGEKETAESPKSAQGKCNGLPVLIWTNKKHDERGNVPFLAKNIQELDDGNPTFNLPAEKLPTELPVWYAPCGPQNGKTLLEKMKATAEYMDLPLQTDSIQDKPNGFLLDCWPYTVSGVLMQAGRNERSQPDGLQEDEICWKVEVDGSYITLTKQDLDFASANSAQTSARAVLSAQADDLALAQFANLVGMQNPQRRCAPLVNPDGSLSYPWFSHFYYEATHSDAPIEQRLQDYWFKRIYGSAGEKQQLYMVRLVVPPSTPQAGIYPLRSLQKAQEALDRRLENDRSNGSLVYEISSHNIVSWKLEYDQDWANPWIQPIYVFTLEVPLEPKQVGYDFAGSEQYNVYVNYAVSAVRPEYCLDQQN